MNFLQDQNGVVSRQQLLSSGWSPENIRRALRRRELAIIQRGVYVNHTGKPAWIQRAWAGLLLATETIDASDVALSYQSAVRIAEGPGRRDAETGTIHVAVSHERRPRTSEGVTIHRCRHFQKRRAPNRHPPRIRYEDAVLDVASAGSPTDALGLLARTVGDRRTTAHRILARLEARGTISQRDWLTRVLIDVDNGTHSVLEHGFLTKVTRPHGLPDPRRQVREETPIGVAYRDASYGGVVVELDGRFHSSFERRDADMDRDLLVAVSGRRTVRLGWGQVFARPCFTAARLSELLVTKRGRPCGPQCSVGDS